MQALHQAITAKLAAHPGEFAVAYLNLQNPADTLLINADAEFHAASTMKTPVLVELYRQAEAGHLRLTDSLTIRNQFSSIVDGSPYQLSVTDDSEDGLYRHLGQARPLHQLATDMITQSSNLATNLLIDLLGAPNVARTMQNLGLGQLKVLRGVEDQKAFDQGLNNTVTARHLAGLFAQLARHQLASPASCQAMMDVLLAQQFNDILPARLPEGVRVAHKTGEIHGVRHDGGLVILPDGRRYVLILLSRRLAQVEPAVVALSEVSRLVYDHFAGQ
ncbi:MAG: class A beta-lactamase-related serine hydrolase [Bernardetiaceae bacterium]|nr:class A beta-lactamase-related serine hydrolase [Bernardetiaceae bacterium]